MSELSKIKQTQEAKQTYWHPIIDLLLSPDGKTKTKEELCEILNTNDREVRDIVAKCSMFYPILSLSGKKGYRRVRLIESLNDEELKKEYEEVRHQIRELNSRIKCLKKKLKPLIAWMKMAEKLRGVGND